jgi:hypothetical protein
MKEIPILFSTPMVQAILKGRKTITRRVVKPQPEGIPCGICTSSFINNDVGGFGFANGEKISAIIQCPFGKPGDLLWVRETFCPDPFGSDGFVYKADFSDPKILGWKPSIFMPKAAARIWLEVVSVKVELLQDISEEDAIKEGVSNADTFRGIGVNDDMANRYAFRQLWEIINGEGSWGLNPWVWVVEFKRI